ncbi:hypothetical protein KPH14_012391 [Odynerus spinipes]|uniref:Uncharacterized protein n=1 Tax=Odynerus spinipes TaxID=1348599 RepID=A0AAD9VMK3_9HYME|nr:hypothetical protein KPH14_012391 [Odynerus spinipes]
MEESTELNDSDCIVSSSSNGFNNLYKSFKKIHNAYLTELVCNRSQKEKRSYFTEVMNDTKYLEDTTKGNAVQASFCFTDSDSKINTNTMDMVATIRNNVPLRILIRRMLDEAFGISNGTENKHCDIDSSAIVKEKSINSDNETNDCSSLHESFSDRLKDNKLVTIEEESVNSLYHTESIECTGMYLSGLLKFDRKPANRIKLDSPSLSRDSTEVSTSQVSTDISINDSSCYTNITYDESSICRENNNGTNKSVVMVNTINSFNDIDLSSSAEKTADFLNILNEENSVETKQLSPKSLNSTEENKRKSSIGADRSVKNKSKFVSTLALNSRGSDKRHRQSVTLFRLTLSKRTPKLSLNTSIKCAKTPYYNAFLKKKQVKSRNVSSMKTTNTPKSMEAPKTPKIYPNRAKTFKTRGIFKQRKMVSSDTCAGCFPDYYTPGYLNFQC